MAFTEASNTMARSTGSDLDPALAAADPLLMREAFSRFPSGVAAVCSDWMGRPDGFAVSSFASGVSLEPPVVLFSAMRDSRSWSRLRTSEHLGISVLGAHQAAVCRSLAARDGDRFGDVATQRGQHGALFISEAPVQLECSVHSETVVGDHVLVLLEVLRARFDSDGEPLLYHQSKFHRLLAT